MGIPPDLNSGGLDGKVAIVTGAGSSGSGIGNGRAAAVLLARAGASTVLIDIVAERMAETQAMIEAEGRHCLTLTADVSNPDSCAEAVHAVAEELGQLDILVNNVGIIGPPGTVVDVDVGDWENCLRVNLTSMMLMSKHVIPHMRRVGGGSIINMSSIAGLVGGFPHVAYSTTKGAIISLTRTMAVQHGPEGIRVNAIAPGFVYTPMVSGAMSWEDRERRRLAAPLQVEGSGWDIGDAVLYLASPRSRWVTGTTLVVDAGLTAAGIAMTSSMTTTPLMGDSLDAPGGSGSRR